MVIDRASLVVGMILAGSLYTEYFNQQDSEREWIPSLERTGSSDGR
jgi:hypothetical protein